MTVTTYLRPRWPGVRPFLLDLGIAVVVSLIVAGSAHWVGPTVWGSFDPTDVQPQPRVYGLLWLATLPIAVRRVVPLWSTALTSVAVLGTILLDFSPGPVFLVAAFQLASLGSQVPLRVSLPALGSTIVLWLFGAAIGGATLEGLATHLVVWVPLLGVPWALGHALRIRRRWRGRALAEEERRRTYGQRLEVAREVHDVVGHSLAVITMQSGIALHVMERRPEQARIALEAIRQQSRDALEELRATLALYRGEPGGEGAPRRPPPRLDDLPALVRTMRSSGMPVE
ncbi:MAG: histidine kinase dimerization/phosphoacceptor domain-containing protein, partial [Candidatus Dormibacteraceae bacterium]